MDTVSYPVSEGDILAVFPGQLHAISCGAGKNGVRKYHFPGA